MKFKLSIFSFLFSILCIAQLNPKTKWGEVSQAEIDYAKVSFEPDAAAVILFEEGKATISGSVQTHIYRRIKILDEKGLEAANQELMLYSYKGSETINSIKAQTLNIENGEVVKYEVDKKSIFDVTVNEYYDSKRFTFPNVKVGSILELEYTLIDQNLYLIDAWRFQHEYPTLFSQYSIKNEMRLDYTSLMIGEKIVQYAKTKKDLTDWKLTNIPSYHSLQFLYNPKDMSERIVFQLRGYMKSQGYDSSSSSYEDVLSNWKDLNKDMDNEFSGYKNESFTKDITSSIPKGKEEKETLENIYHFFKQNYKWNNFYGISPHQSNRDLEKTKSGNATDLNLMLNSILKNSGFKVDLVLLSSRDHGKLITSYPYLGQFNYVINLVTLSNGSTYLIDASDMSYDLGYAPLRDYNHFGLIVDPKSENFIHLNLMISEYHSLQNYVLKDGNFIVNRSEKRNGYFKEKIQNLPEGIEKYNPQSNAVDLFTTEKKRDIKDSDENDFELERIISETSSFEKSNFISVENPLKNLISGFKLNEPNRERALEYNFPFFYKTDVVIEIPKGFEIQIPEGFNIHRKLSTDELVYYQSAEIKEEKLIFHIEFYLGKAVFDKNYAELKSFFEKINLDASKTILMKKN